ncbi:MAG: MarR family transcriptional regulator [Crocinitomicaceae bacterium]|nr:MarR family transcriptional regulator [Crocinitomicaceae bacterium]
MDTIIATKTVFYSIERTIKEYRKFAQNNISAKVKDITVDQALILFFLKKHPELSQQEIATLVFKDKASVTRMINLMVSKGYLERSINEENRRRFKLEITDVGEKVLFDLAPIISNNRNKALQGITEEEVIQMETTLNKIISNCI